MPALSSAATINCRLSRAQFLVQSPPGRQYEERLSPSSTQAKGLVVPPMACDPVCLGLTPDHSFPFN